MLTVTVELRTATPADDTFLRDVFADGRRDEFAGLGDDALAPLLDLQRRAQTADRATRHPGAITSVVLADGEPVGSVTIDRTAPDGGTHLVDIAVLSAHRGRGIGSQVIDGIVHSGGRVTLSVWALNAGAIRLYERLGFQVDAEQSGYLSMSREPNV